MGRAGLRDEYMIETSYRAQILPSLALIPDVQLVINPAGNPDKDNAWVLGMKLHLSL